MELNEYQRLANSTDQKKEKNQLISYVVPLLGIVGEIGSLVSEFKKRFRDGNAHVFFQENIKEELGDVLWYISNIASKFNLSLEDIAASNLGKLKERFPSSGQPICVTPLFDENCSSDEKIPREFVVELTTNEEGKAVIYINGLIMGDSLSDNAYEEDGFKFHDVFHFAFAAVLGWSPVLRALLRKKRKSNPLVDEVEDGARAAVLEEGISAYLYTQAKRHKFYEGVETIDSNILITIKHLVEHLEVSKCTSAEWQRAIIEGYRIFRKVRENKGGTILVPLNERMLYLIE